MGPDCRAFRFRQAAAVGAPARGVGGGPSPRARRPAFASGNDSWASRSQPAILSLIPAYYLLLLIGIPMHE